MRIIYIALLGAVFSFSSCKKYLDINTNPNAAEKVDAGLLFTTSAVQYVTKRTDGDMWIPIALAGQTVAGGGDNALGWGFPTEEQYNFDPLQFGNPWNQIYTVVGSGLRQGINIAEAAQPANINGAAQCRVLLAAAMYDMAAIYGDIPYSEAFRTDITYPHFDTQQQALEGIVATLDSAIAEFDESSALAITTNDVIYKGNIASWSKFAKSLKLRVLMTEVDKDPSKAAAIGQLVTGGGLISSADENAGVAFSSTAGRENPKFAVINQFFPTDDDGELHNPFNAVKHTTDFMNSISDPRLPFYFKKPVGQTTYIGVVNGATSDDEINPRVSMKLQTADEPEYLFTYQEELFFEAEVYARGLGVDVDMAMADSKLKEAVRQSALFYGVSEGDATAFSESLPALSSLGNNRNAVKYIDMHHWIDEMDRPLEAFTQWRRSGPEGDEVPDLQLPIGAPAGGLFRRYEYPTTNEVLVNPNAPQDRIKYDTKTWFDL